MSIPPVATTIAIPCLETARLLLRAHRQEDYPDCQALWGDPKVTRHIGGRPQSGEEVWQRLLRYVGHWCWQGYGFWVVIEKDSGRLVGEVGFADFKRDLQPPLNGEPEAGWVLAPWSHGRGYATEAMRAALSWGETRFGSSRIVCLIAPENLTSIRVAQKCGFVAAGTATYQDTSTLVFERRPGAPGSPQPTPMKSAAQAR